MRVDWNIGDCLRMSALKFPHREAVKFGDKVLTYEQFYARCCRLANTLIGLGLGRGDKCAVMLYNSIESLETLMGMALAGITCVPVNWRFSAREIEYALTHSDSKAVVFADDFMEIMAPLAESIVGVQNSLVVGADPGPFQSYEDRLARAAASRPEVKIGFDDVWYIGYTAGTTKAPKGVLITHGPFIQNTAGWLIEYARLTEDDNFLLIMPLFHSNSIWIAAFTFTVGGMVDIYHSGAFDPEEILQIIERDRITTTSVVPTMLSLTLCLSEKAKTKYDLSSLHTIMCASAPLWTSTKEGTLRLFPKVSFYEAYGATETGLITVLKPKYQWSKVRSVGKPFLFKEVRLLDENGNDVPVGQPGEIYVRGLGIFLGQYYKDPESTAKAFRGEWCTVEDIAIRDEEGFYYLVDRKQDMIISGGENISPSEVEDQIAAHPAVNEVAVVSQPSELWGDAVTAVVVLNNGQRMDGEEIKSFCRSRLAGFKVPKFVDFADELPKSPTGKILRKKIREKYWADYEVKL